MEYNTNWKAIQQWFLPCKSRHQIFVRQKNRCSSKAPENPIKAVWRMKTSPLTVEEITCIQEGRKVYKLDWMSVWRFFVPHREPSLLPRQWLVAFGTQRSYKQDEAKKERQCLYESKRKKSAKLEVWQVGKLHLKRRMIKLKMLEERIKVEMRAQIMLGKVMFIKRF